MPRKTLQILFGQISKIENRYNAPSRELDEQQLIEVVLKAATEQYQLVLTSVKLEKGNSLSLSVLENAMNRMWKPSGKNKKSSSSEVAHVQ